MQEQIYSRLLAVETTSKTVKEQRKRLLLKNGEQTEEFYTEDVLVNDRNEIHVRVFPSEFGYLLRLDASGTGEGIKLLGFTREREEALNFAMKVKLEEAKTLASVQFLLGLHISCIADAAIERAPVTLELKATK